MRLLHPRDDHAGAGAARAQPPIRRDAEIREAHGAAICAAAARTCASCARSSARARADEAGALGMTDSPTCRSRAPPHLARRRARRQLRVALPPRLAQARQPPAAQLPGQPERPAACSTPGSASTPTARVTVFTGKAELGQGIKTALIQIAAEELDVGPRASRSSPPTRRARRTRATPRAATRCRTAAPRSCTRRRRCARCSSSCAAKRLGVAAERLDASRRRRARTDGRRRLRRARRRRGAARAGAAAVAADDPAAHTVVGQAAAARRHPGEGDRRRRLRAGPAPARHGARARACGRRATAREAARRSTRGSVERMPGVLKVVRDGSFVAVVAEREYQAIRRCARWPTARDGTSSRRCRAAGDLSSMLRALPAQDTVIRDTRRRSRRQRRDDRGDVPAALPDARLDRAVVRGRAVQDGALTVWTHSQGVYPLRGAIAEMLGMPQERVRCIHIEGAGCYGHNGADDAAADAALIARALPGRPVRVQWMREDEHAWEPFGPAMLSRRARALDAAGNVVDWQYEVWSNTHSTRPGHGGQSARRRGRSRSRSRRRRRSRSRSRTAAATATRSRSTRFANARVVHHFIPDDAAARVGAARARRVHEHVLDRELHGRARAPRRAPIRSSSASRISSDPRAQAVVSHGRRALRLAGLRSARPAAAAASPSRATRTSPPISRSRCEVEVERDSGERARRPRGRGGRQRRGVNPDGIAQPDRRRHRAVAELDAARGGGVRPRRGSRAATGAAIRSCAFRDVPESVEVHVDRSPGPAVPRHRRGGAGPDRRGAGERVRRRDRHCACASCRSLPRE